MSTELFTDRFDPYQYHHQGFSIGWATEETLALGRDIIQRTQWNDTVPHMPTWMTEKTYLDSVVYDWRYLEYIKRREIYNNAPSDIKYLAERLLKEPFFETLLPSFLPENDLAYSCYRGIRTVNTFLGNKTDGESWHSDHTDGSDFFINLYVTDGDWDPAWGGALQFGHRDRSGTAQETHRVYPHDGMLVIFNNSNPYLTHAAEGHDAAHNRYLFSIHYEILDH